MDSPEPTSLPVSRIAFSAHDVLILVILLSSFVLKLQNLGHAAIHTPDEVITAVVSQNLLKHPLVPTLIDRPYLPYDDTDWQNSHLWLFKPPVAFWQIAAGFAVFGVNTFMLRLPSAILSTLAVLLTYLIGRRWLHPTAGLIAAGVQAFNPAILMLVHGYLFSDHIDIALLFWSEAGVYFLSRSLQGKQRRADLVLCGVAQGFAFLSKWHLALFVAGLAVMAWLLPKTRLVMKAEARLSGRNLLVILGTAILTVAPWLTYIGLRYPTQLAFINSFVLQHLNQNMSNWAAPWDRLLFDYNIRIFYLHYPAMLASIVWATVRAFQHKRLGLWLTLAWAAGVFLPNVLAQTKTPSSTLIGWPACWLLLGYMIYSAVRGDRWALGIWLVSMLASALFLTNACIPGETWGYGPYFGAIMIEHIWVLWHLLVALILGGLIGYFIVNPKTLRPLATVAAAAAILLAVRWWGDEKDANSRPRGYVNMAWRVTRIKADRPDFTALGAFARSLPSNAAFVVDERFRSEARLMQFASDRPCYPRGSEDWSVRASQLLSAGALPYLLTPADEPLPTVFVDREEGRMIYACSPGAKAAADQRARNLAP